MIARSLLHLLRRKHKAAVYWLTGHLGADSVTCLGASGSGVQLEARRGDDVRTFQWDSADILTALEQNASDNAVAFAWVVCRLHDLVDETDSMLRDFVKSSTGLAVEPVPFRREGRHLLLICDRKSCNGTERKSEEVVLEVQGNDLAVGLLLSSSGAKELLFGRLRRTVL